jgi:hypothetical protein
MKNSKKEINSREQEIFFTMKVYATQEKGKIKTLKYSIDLNPPFDANTDSIKPYASPIGKENITLFDKIFDNVKELMRFISNPTEYNPKSPQSKGWRLEEQKNLAEAIRLSKGAINHITFEQNSPPVVTVGALFQTSGNGDMRPPSTT